MQKSICIVLLPLFLILILGVCSLSYCNSDIRDSVLFKFGSTVDSVMASETMMRGRKRLLIQCAAGSNESKDTIEQRRTRRTARNRVFFGGDEYDQINSERWKTMFDPQIAEASNVCENVTGIEHSDKQWRANDQNVGATLNEDPFMGLEVMPVETACTRTRHAENYDNQGEIQEICDAQNSSITAAESESIFSGLDKGHQIRSERWRKAFGPAASKKSQTLSHSESTNDHSLFLQTDDTRGECSHSFGQALNQKRKQGSAVTYEDSVNGSN